jgi:hypothetical protein
VFCLIASMKSKDLWYFLWAEGMQGTEIHTCICLVWDNALSQKSVYKWIEMFKKAVQV